MTTFKTEAAVNLLNRRHLTCFSAMQTLKLLTIYNFIAGFIFLVLRQSGYLHIDYTGFSLAGLPVCMLLAIIVATRQAIPREKLLALLDSSNHSGGLLLAGQETGDHSWENRITQDLVVPEFALNYSARLPGLILSFMFLALCVKMPVYSLFSNKDPRIQLSELHESTLEQVQALSETGALEPEKAGELQETLQQISDASDGNDPAKTFEAFDQLQEKLRREAARESQKMAADLDDLGKLAELADNMTQNAQNDPEKMKQAAQELQKAMEQTEVGKAMQQQSSDEFSRNLEEVVGGGENSLEASQKAAQELQKYISEHAEKIKEAANRMLKAKLIDRTTFEKLQREGKIKPATAEDIEKNPDAELIMAPCEDGEAGQGQGQGMGQDGSGTSGDGQSGMSVDGEGLGAGGVSRGGGTAPLQFNRKTSEHNVSFHDERLPAPAEGALDDSVTIGVGVAEPQVNGEEKSAPFSPVDWKQPGKLPGESAIILPRHRSAVKKYFDRIKP